MREGSAIIDLAAVTGGNTELTQNSKEVMHHGVTIIGNSALPSAMPSDASKLYSKNILNFLKLIIDKDGNINLNWEDDLVKGTCIVYDQKIVNERVSSIK